MRWQVFYFAFSVLSVHAFTTGSVTNGWIFEYYTRRKKIKEHQQILTERIIIPTLITTKGYKIKIVCRKRKIFMHFPYTKFIGAFPIFVPFNRYQVTTQRSHTSVGTSVHQPGSCNTSTTWNMRAITRHFGLLLLLFWFSESRWCISD